MIRDKGINNSRRRKLSPTARAPLPHRDSPTGTDPRFAEKATVLRVQARDRGCRGEGKKGGGEPVIERFFQFLRHSRALATRAPAPDILLLRVSVWLGAKLLAATHPHPSKPPVWHLGVWLLRGFRRKSDHCRLRKKHYLSSGLVRRGIESYSLRAKVPAPGRLTITSKFLPRKTGANL